MFFSDGLYKKVLSLGSLIQPALLRANTLGSRTWGDTNDRIRQRTFCCGLRVQFGSPARCLVVVLSMGRFRTAELKKFRDTSHCSACVHYSGCALWLSILLMNEELSAPGLDLIVPDLSRPCAMFFSWTSASAQKHTTNKAA
jgi:hypothetical protein